MSPEKTKIFLAEDDEISRKGFVMTLKAQGHEVVIEVSSLDEALISVEKAKEKGVNLALIDGSLPYDPSDGLRVAQALREKIPDIKIISISCDVVDWGDENLCKPFSGDELVEKMRLL